MALRTGEKRLQWTRCGLRGRRYGRMDEDCPQSQQSYGFRGGGPSETRIVRREGNALSHGQLQIHSIVDGETVRPRQSQHGRFIGQAVDAIPQVNSTGSLLRFAPRRDQMEADEIRGCDRIEG